VARAVAVLTAALLWLAVPHDRMAGTFLPLRVLARVGVFSYSLYLVHVTVLSPFLNLAQRFVPPSNTTFILCWTAAVAAAFGAGWILHHCVEAPAERWRKARWRARPAESINAT
jgi:peptidoglycan/LPS O-acetylase OafA/YrhL